MVRARLEPELKKHTEAIFQELGLSVTQAITLFYKQVEARNGLPFNVVIPSKETSATFESTDAGNTWHILSGNMPATAIWDMKIVDNQVVLGTCGRGIWSTDINELPGHVFIPEIISSTPSISGELLLNVNMSVEFDSSYVYIDGVLLDNATIDGSSTIIWATSLSTNEEWVEIYAIQNNEKFHVIDLNEAKEMLKDIF